MLGTCDTRLGIFSSFAFCKIWRHCLRFYTDVGLFNGFFFFYFLKSRFLYKRNFKMVMNNTKFGKTSWLQPAVSGQTRSELPAYRWRTAIHSLFTRLKGCTMIQMPTMEMTQMKRNYFLEGTHVHAFPWGLHFIWFVVLSGHFVAICASHTHYRSLKSALPSRCVQSVSDLMQTLPLHTPITRRRTANLKNN